MLPASETYQGPGLVPDVRHEYICNPMTYSFPLASAIGVDLVTNGERVKPSEITRILSPLRPRRTPVLVNAPEVPWRLAPSPRLIHLPSLDSFVSPSPSSAPSTICRVPARPQDISLPSSHSSSVITVLSQGHSDTIDAPVSVPPPVHIEIDDEANHPRWSELKDDYQPHLLSPVTEVSVAPSIRSSIVDLSVQDVSTAERRRVGSGHRQNVSVVEQSPQVSFEHPNRQVRRKMGMPSLVPHERPADPGTCGLDAHPRWQEAVSSRNYGEKMGGKRKCCWKTRGLKQSVQIFRSKVMYEMGRKLVIHALARVL